jgi:formate/nitrite transporter
MPEIFGFDCYSPKEIAEHVENVGVVKAKLPMLSMVALGVLAGGFIGLGALSYNLVVSDASLGFAASRMMGGMAFSLGLILVVVAGAELFTGNNLLVMAWVSGSVCSRELLRNLVVVYVSNLIGAMGLALLVKWSGHLGMAGGEVGRSALKIAAAKCAMPFAEAFFKAVLCNVLVCLAVWIAMAGRNVTDKIMAIIFPISAFVAAGFEHSVANMYFIPLGLMVREEAFASGLHGIAGLTWPAFIHNLILVTLGNLAGGAGMVGLVFWVIYRRGKNHEPFGKT